MSEDTDKASIAPGIHPRPPRGPTRPRPTFGTWATEFFDAALR